MKIKKCSKDVLLSNDIHISLKSFIIHVKYGMKVGHFEGLIILSRVIQGQVWQCILIAQLSLQIVAKVYFLRFFAI